jgi:SET domain-containing protein
MKANAVSNKTYIYKSEIPTAGQGVFAKHIILKGEAIEVCPFLKLPRHEIKRLENSILINYIFFAGAKKNIPLLVLGHGSLYNHSENPNAKHSVNLKKKTITFTATKSIKKDEEITFNYKGGKPKSRKSLWFEAE